MPPSSDKGGSNATGKLDIIHRYLVMQIFLQPGDPLSIELQVRDKANVSLEFSFLRIDDD